MSTTTKVSKAPAGSWAMIRVPRDLYEVWSEAESRVAKAMNMSLPLSETDRKTVIEAIAAMILNTPESILRSEVGET